MTLPTGTISMSEVNVELGLSATAAISLNDTAVRNLAGVPSGAISMDNLRGKTNVFTFAIASNTTNANLRTLAVNAGWNQSSPVEATVNSGVYVYSTSTGTPGLTIDGSWPGGITLINNGFILGRGGNGASVPAFSGAAGAAGGNAISLGVNCAITNNSYIAGGGGGGSSGWFSNKGAYFSRGGGGGAGAGDGGSASGLGGGAGGAPGAVGGDGTVSGGSIYSGGGGGRILPGVGGTTLAPDGRSGGGGAGGAGDVAGGSANNPGGVGQWGGGGGGWGASGGSTTSSAGGNFAGGAGGKAVALNGYSVTWNANGTRYGAIS